MVPATKSGQDGSFSNFGGWHLFFQGRFPQGMRPAMIMKTETPVQYSRMLLPVVTTLIGSFFNTSCARDGRDRD